MVVFHDFLDHLDGIVAKVHRRTYPNQDDPLLGGFLDAFCDKIVNIFSLWSIIQMTPIYDNNYFMLLYVITCYSVIVYETIIGVVRVEDYFTAKFQKYFEFFFKKIILSANYLAVISIKILFSKIANIISFH